MNLRQWQNMKYNDQVNYIFNILLKRRLKMENRTLNAALKVRTKEKEKELFYEACKKNKTSGQAVLREYILKYIEVNTDKC